VKAGPLLIAKQHQMENREEIIMNTHLIRHHRPAHDAWSLRTARGSWATLALILTLAMPVAAAAAPGPGGRMQQLGPESRYEPPWVGYDVGQSAYPGNPDPFERDPTSLTVADLDGDGWLDVAVANYEFAAPGGGTDGLSGFAVLFNQGDGTFGTPQHRTVSNQGCWDIAAADFDEDGDQDIAVSVANAFFEGQQVRVYFNDGLGSFPTSRSMVAVDGPIGLAVADFDGDAHLDIAAANFRSFEAEGLISVFLGDGAGFFAPQATYPVGSRPWKLEAGDLDGDGHPDLAVAHEGQAVTVLYNDGDGTFGTPVAYSGLFPLQGGMYYGCLTLADADRDGNLDIFYGNTRSHQLNEVAKIVHLHNEGNSFTRFPDISLTPYSAGPADLTSGDVDGDDWPDLVAVHFAGTTGDGPRLVLNDGAGSFGPAQAIPAGQATFAAVLADVDLDGRQDLLAADRFSMQVTVHGNTELGIPVLESLYPTAGINIRMDLGDVDGDGDLDAFTSTESTGGPGALVRNRGDGTFDPPVLYTHSEQYGRGVARAKLRDLDGDGDLDLLYNDAHTDFHNGYDFHVALNDGAGLFAPIVEWPLGTCGNGDIDAFDLDGDGDLDVVNCEELACGGGGANRLFISINQGDATFDPPYVVQISTGPHALIGGDFNGDGHIDLATTHWMPYGFRDFINVHLGNGDGSFQEETVYLVGQGPRWIVTDDFDGDGHADLATANSGRDNEGRETLTLLFGDGTGAFGGRQDYYAPFSPDLLAAQGLTAGDYDRDGYVDLLMVTAAGGVAVYRNDGSGAFAIMPRLGATWSPWSIAFDDVTGDGLEDLIMLASDGLSGLGRFVAVLPATVPGTVNAQLGCTPASGTLPFAVQLSADLVNATLFSRRMAARMDIVIASGHSYANYRSGWTTLGAKGSYSASWSQALPAAGSLVGDNIFTLTAQDVTPSPFNQPPYPMSGDTCTDVKVVTGIAP
jgi:hypothetical protein